MLSLNMGNVETRFSPPNATGLFLLGMALSFIGHGKSLGRYMYRSCVSIDMSYFTCLRLYVYDDKQPQIMQMGRLKQLSDRDGVRAMHRLRPMGTQASVTGAILPLPY